MYRTVFPNFGKLDVVVPKDFIDDSAPEHKMPTFRKTLPNGNIMRVWVDFKDKAKSQYPNSPRFRISVYNASMLRIHDDILLDHWWVVLLNIDGLTQYNTVHQTDFPD